MHLIERCKAETLSANQLTCPVPACAQLCNSVKALGNHIVEAHDIGIFGTIPLAENGGRACFKLWDGELESLSVQHKTRLQHASRARKRLATQQEEEQEREQAATSASTSTAGAASPEELRKQHRRAASLRSYRKQRAAFIAAGLPKKPRRQW